MASEHGHKEHLIRPGNKEYLSFYNYQRRWKPTKSIGLIGAMTASPGPAAVNLPTSIGEKDHDLRKFKAPAYKIGLKEEKHETLVGPGPAHYNICKKTNKGLDVCHAPIIGDKLEGHMPYISPGPAVHHRGDSDNFAFPKGPEYTIAHKIKPLKSFLTPDPPTYTLPDTLGPGYSPYKKSPCYSIREKLDKAGMPQMNPGPAAYLLPSSDVHKPKAPRFTMRAKDKYRPSVIVSPGPASNECHMVKLHKPATPRFTFGIRHTPFEAFQYFAAEK